MPERKQTLEIRSAVMALALIAIFVFGGCGGGRQSSSGSATNPFGLSTAAVLSASSQSLSFGDVMIGTATSQLVSLTNTGTEKLKIASVKVSGQGYTVTGGSNVTLTPNQTVTIYVNFGPSTSGYAGGTLAITSDASNSVLQVGVSGNGVTTQQSGHGVSLSWTPSSSNVIGYFVYRSTVSGGPYTKLNATVDSQPT